MPRCSGRVWVFHTGGIIRGEIRVLFFFFFFSLWFSIYHGPNRHGSDLGIDQYHNYTTTYLGTCISPIYLVFDHEQFNNSIIQ